MRTFADILNSAPSIVDVLAGYERYWAHIHSCKEPELLHEHVKLVNEYARELVKVHGLDAVIDALLTEYTAGWESKEDAVFLKELFVDAIVFHDFGKVNENFQATRMQNKAFVPSNNVAMNPPHGHSFLGAFLFLNYEIKRLSEEVMPHERRTRLICHCFFFAYVIMQHHNPALYDVTEREGFMVRFKGTVEDLKRYAEGYGFDFDRQKLDNILSNAGNAWHTVVKNKTPAAPFPLFALVKLNFSLLTAADYLATHDYMNGSKDSSNPAVVDLGVFNSRERVNEIIAYLQSFRHNADTFYEIEHYRFFHPADRSKDNLNLLRKEMAIEVVQNIRANLDAHLFYLEAPTGGGKTNLSAIAVTELLKAREAITKVFFVFPFTTLITQTFAALKESMGLHNEEIVELHSKASFFSKTEGHQDGLFGDAKKDFIDNLFALYPVTLMSHVKFFDVLKTNKKESNYLLHRLANSIVVIDEIQSYNPSIWDKMLYFIGNYARFFNIKFILMSATLPKISELEVGLSEMLPFVELIPNARRYIVNPNFSKRVSFNFELFEQGDISLESLVSSVIEKSQNYAEAKGFVRTIVEFIYKGSASRFQRLVVDYGFFDEVFVLSGTILESRRREVINFIRRTAQQGINILLITTQVVEAGVDIDMDLGFKNVSLLDSDEQLAGRVNRNASKDDCEVYLFKLDDARLLYGKDYRYVQTREHISTDLYKDILRTKDFKRLYEKVLLKIDDLNRPEYSDSISGYQAFLRDLRYPDVDKGFQIIEQENKLVFVPMRVPVLIEGSRVGDSERVFTPENIYFLNEFGVQEEEVEFNGKLIACIDGEKVWGVYKQLIERQSSALKGSGGFDIRLKIEFKILQSIMAKFSFSLISHSKDYRKIEEGFGLEEYGYMYFSHWNDVRENGKIYGYETGLNSEAFSDANFI